MGKRVTLNEDELLLIKLSLELAIKESEYDSKQVLVKLGVYKINAFKQKLGMKEPTNT